MAATDALIDSTRISRMLSGEAISMMNQIAETAWMTRQHRAHHRERLAQARGVLCSSDLRTDARMMERANDLPRPTDAIEEQRA